MSLNNADTYLAPTGSIKARLTLFYSLATAILLSVTAFFLFFATSHIMHKANQQFLSDEIDVIKNLLENKSDHLFALKQEMTETPYTQTPSEYHFYIRILDDKNKILLETPHFSSLLKDAELFNEPATASKKSSWWNDANHTPYLLMQATGTFGKTHEPVLIQAALDISYQQHILIKSGKILFLIFISVMLIAILMGYFIASRGMRSLYRLTEATTNITATSLHQRIDPNSWPKELHKLGIAFNQMLERIETAVLHLTQFAGDLAHELRSPINNLMGETEIALSQYSTSVEYRLVLESNLEELQRIAHIIENLLFLARAENPKLELKKEWIHVEKEISLITEFYQAIADEKEIRVSQEGNATLFVNVIMFRRALSNLLSNALKYTPKKGTIQFLVREKTHVVEIDIKDSGIGIDPEHLPKIFHRFYRVDSARARSEGGIGLGLAIVKSIIDLHHGNISIVSEPGKNCIFTLTLPKIIAT
jgi:two-component system heavy metal sensor histidine kinase CusS